MLVVVRSTSSSFKVTFALAVTLLGFGCRTSDQGVKPMIRDGGGDAPVVQDGSFRETAPSCSTMPIPADKKNEGSDCKCGQECLSGNCVDDVCCNSPCTGTCMACNVPSSKGTCSPVPDRQMPRMTGQCVAEPVSTCGLDGTCNGSGGCRKYADGTQCAPGTCQGSSVMGGKVCSEGACVAGPTTICAPYNCDSVGGRCFSRCTSDADCDGRPCMGGSCGKKALGAECSGNDDCDSSYCADGVCCNVACSGACVSCNQAGKMGECSAVGAGSPDPHSKCAAEPPTTCGLSGLCNGLGGCARHAAGTECLPASCSSGSEIPMSICDGNGTCLVGAPVPCAPYICAGTACMLSCTSNAQCTPGIPCANGSCGKFPMGAPCMRASDCASNFCVDGYCCNSACGGTCENCGLPNARGRCTAVGAGAVDPRGVCKDNGGTSCGTNGRCNGSRGCQTYSDGTPCKAASCNGTNNTQTQAGTCRNGSCSVPTATACAPYKCNGTTCGTRCGGNADCQAPSTCVLGSCGLKPLGAACARGDECASKLCAQGVCCNSACTGSCLSCNQTGVAGQCTAVPSGAPDPAGVCRDQGRASCGTDGTCNGLGGCKRYPDGTECLSPRCNADVATPASTCLGGQCRAGTPRACSPYRCNAGATACTDSCSSSAQCLPPNICDVTGHCGKKGIGSLCSTGSECVSGQCVEGVCCNTACTESCKTCALPSSPGTCTNVPDGQSDPKSICAPAMEATCGNDGKCNGAGACRKWSGVVCRQPVCTGSTLMPGASCNGSGSCPAAGAVNCSPYTCNDGGTACRTTCAGPSDCTAGNACIGGVCQGKKANGNDCGGNDQCTSGNCVNGVCCNDACTGSCRSCTLTGSVGTCTNVPAGGDDPSMTCTNQPGCGQTGKCNGSGACQLRGAETSCSPTCTGNNSVQPQVCNGSGACTDSGAATSCGNHACNMGACATPCTVDAHCVSGKVCIMPGGTCQDPPPDPDAGM